MAALCVCLTCLPYLSQVKASPALGRVVAQLLVPDPAKRPSAEELVSMLEPAPYMSALNVYICLRCLPYMSALYVTGEHA